MVQIVFDITDYCIIYGTYFVLLILVYLFIANFVSHFKFNYKCPYVLRDEEVNGIYPTLLTLHVSISLLVSSLIAAITQKDEYYVAHSTFAFASCYIRFALFSTNVLSPNFMDTASYLLVLWPISVLFLLETYFSYSRYYGCAMVVEEFRVPTKWRVFRPYIAYIVLLWILIWCTISILPIIMLFLCIFHFIINTYFSYFFYISVKQSYAQVFKCHKDVRFIGDAYDQMQQQIKQIRFVFHLAMLSALISAFVTFSFTLCDALRLVPFGLCANSLCLYLMLTKNRLLLKSTLRCQCEQIHELMCVVPWSVIEKRKASAFPHPSTLMKIKTSSIKVLRGIPRQLTPVLGRIRTSSKADKINIAPPPNTPRFHGQAPSELNLDIINEDNPNKFSLHSSHDDLTNTSSHSQKRISTTQSSDGIEEITTNSAKISSRSRHLKPYSLTTSSFVSKPTTSHTPTPDMPGRLSIDFAMSGNLHQLDTIPAEDEMITFADAVPHLPCAHSIEADKSLSLQNRSSPKRYRSRRHHSLGVSNASMPSIYPDETDIVEGFEMMETYHQAQQQQQEEDEEEEGIYFARMENIRATMHADHIDEIKNELALFDIEDDDDDDTDAEMEVKEDHNKAAIVKEEDQRSSLKKKVEQIELTKEELQKEKKVLQLKKKTNKRIAFGADMALEIVQESIARQDEKRKAAQHEFYISAIMMNNNNTFVKSASAHQMTPTPAPHNSNVPLKVPKATPSHTPVRKRSFEDANLARMLKFKHQTSANTNGSDDNIPLTDEEEEIASQPPIATVTAAHLRSQSDNEIIVDIANQIALFAKQLSLQKTGSERPRKVNPPKLKDRNPKKAHAHHQRPKLNPKSASEDVDTHKKRRSDVLAKTHGIFLSPNDATPSFKPRKYDAEDDEMDDFDIDGVMEASPSPPPEAYLDAMSGYRHDTHDRDPNDLSSQHSIWQTFRSFRSWLSPSIRMNSTIHSSQEDSERANNINVFLKKQGFGGTMRSEKKRFSDLVTPIPIPEHQRVVHLDIDDEKPGTIQEGDEDEEEETTQYLEEEEEEEEKRSVPTGHCVFSIISVDDYNNKEGNMMGHEIMNLDAMNVATPYGHSHQNSTAL